MNILIGKLKESKAEKQKNKHIPVAYILSQSSKCPLISTDIRPYSLSIKRIGKGKYLEEENFFVEEEENKEIGGHNMEKENIFLGGG